MKKTLILLGMMAITPLANAQLLLEALEGGVDNTSTTPSTQGKAEVWNRTHYIPSFNHNGKNIQGLLDNTTNRLSINIPYNEAWGTYNEINVSRTVQDKNGNTKTLTLHIPAGTLKTKDFLTADIIVGNGSSDTYNVKQLDANVEEIITTFSFSINGRTSNVTLIATGGILDRNFNKPTNGQLKHQFVYMPMSMHIPMWRGNYYYNFDDEKRLFLPDKGEPYEHTWLSQNLGAEYADANNPNGNYNPIKVLDVSKWLLKDDYTDVFPTNDALAFGSLFEWQRPADGHELVDWVNGVLTPTTTTLSANADWTAGHSNFIIGGNTSWTTDQINRSPNNQTLWTEGGANNPCPIGYHVPKGEELNKIDYIHASSFAENRNYITPLVLPYVPARQSRNTNSPFSGGFSGYWGSIWKAEIGGYISDVKPALVRDYAAFSWGTLNDTFPVYGMAIRCIKD